MKKQTVRLNESQFNNIIKNCVKSILKENLEQPEISMDEIKSHLHQVKTELERKMDRCNMYANRFGEQGNGLKQENSADDALLLDELITDVQNVIDKMDDFQIT